MKHIVWRGLAFLWPGGLIFSAFGQMAPVPAPETIAPKINCSAQLIAPVPHKSVLLQYLGRSGFDRMAEATNEANFQTMMLKLFSSKLYIEKLWEQTDEGTLPKPAPADVYYPLDSYVKNDLVSVYQRELATLDELFHFYHPSTLPPKAAAHGIDFGRLEEISPAITDPMGKEFWFWQELDNYAQQHRLSSSAILRAGHPSLVVGLLNFRIIKTAALHNCTYLKTVLDLKAAPQGPVGQLSPAQSKIYQDFFAQYPFYKENLALVYSFPIIWRSLESVNYDDLVGAMDLTGNFHDVRYPTLISLTHQHFQRLAHSSAPEDRQALQNYFSTALRELHLDFEENMDFIHLLYAMMPDGVRDIFYASWLQGKHPTLPLHQAYTPRQKRLPRLTFWQENLAITQINKQQADLSTQDELARNTFQAIKQKRLAAGMNWEDFIFTQEANVVYFAYDYLFTTIRTQLINQAAPGWSDELIARHPDLPRATFDPRYLSPAQAHAVRDVLERGIRSVKDKLFYAAYWPLAQIFGPDRLKVARMADPRLANFLLTYKIGR